MVVSASFIQVPQLVAVKATPYVSGGDRNGLMRLVRDR